MLIDWFTVGAQVLNFLILVGLMKRFLYRPILNALDEREKRITAQLSDADTKKAEAQAERDSFAQKNATFDSERAGLLKRATEEAQAERQRLIREARVAADALSKKRMEDLLNDTQNLDHSIRARAQHEVYAIAKKVLTDLAGVSLEARVGEEFVRRLGEMDAGARDRLRAAMTTTSEPVTVRSAFELPAPQQGEIQNALNVALSAEVPLRFEVAPQLVSGVELTANGHKIAWSISDYLRGLQESLGELLDAARAPPAEDQTPQESEAEPEVAPAPSPKAKSVERPAHS